MHMTRTVVTSLTVILLVSNAAHAQTDSLLREHPRAVAYWETFGNSTLPCCSGSLEWPVGQHLDRNGHRTYQYFRLGAGSFPVGDEPPRHVLAMINHLHGGRGRYLETGAGMIVGSTWLQRRIVVGPSFSVGYRKQTKCRFLRLSFTPYLGPFAKQYGKRVIPSFGISVGRIFHNSATVNAACER
jgi:hypothetical protein